MLILILASVVKKSAFAAASEQLERKLSLIISMESAVKSGYRKQKSDYRTPQWAMDKIRAIRNQATLGYIPPPDNASQGTTEGRITNNQD